MIMANTGYFVGIGIEVFVILICAALLALMLTGLLFKWLAQYNESRLVKSAVKAAAAEALAVYEEEAAAQAAAEAEAERIVRVAEAQARAEAEAVAAEAAAAAAAAKAEEEAAAREAAAAAAAAAKAAQPEPEPEEEPVVTERVVERIIEREVVQQPAVEEAAVAEAEAEEEEPEAENEFVVVQDGIVFNDSKTITELYDELSPEQQSYFDELREEALTKPDAELAIAKNFVTVKIGKRNLIKLLIKRGVTVAEFMLENDALKALRLSNTNKRGKSAIKIKPTVVQVLDLTSLKVAVDMINLAYEELMLGD